MFFSKKTDVDMVSLHNSISILKQRVDSIELTIEAMKTNQTSLRGLINRKLGNEEIVKTEEEPKKVKTEDLNNLIPKFI
jgi:hypothetical protein